MLIYKKQSCYCGIRIDNFSIVDKLRIFGCGNKKGCKKFKNSIKGHAQSFIPTKLPDLPTLNSFIDQKCKNLIVLNTQRRRFYCFDRNDAILLRLWLK